MRWPAISFDKLQCSSQNGFGSRSGDGHPTVVLRLADIDSDSWTVARDGLREIGMSAANRTKYGLNLGDLLVVRVNGSPSIAGRVIPYFGPEGLVFCDHFIRFKLVETVNPRFIAYQFRHRPVRAQVERGMVSTAGQHTISQRTLSTIQIELPPLAVQHRIVSAIDLHCSRVDAADASLTRAKANVKRARASVLQAAVEGRLVPTEEALARAEGRDYEPASVLLERILTARKAAWDASGKRGEYKEPVAIGLEGTPDLPEGWCWSTLDGLAHVVGGITKNSKLSSGRSVPYLRVANVQRGRLDLREIKVIMATSQQIDLLKLEPGDVLLNEGGDRDKLGRGWVWSGQLPECIHQNHVFRARLWLPAFDSRYLSHYTNIQGVRYFLTQGRQTTNLASISLSNVKALPVPIPPALEIARILAEVDRRLSVLDKLDASIDANLARCARLRQSILKRAFEGRLVPPDDAEGDAHAEPTRRHTARQATPATIAGSIP